MSLSALGPLCKVLLQAAPPLKDMQTVQLQRALGMIESHPHVVRVSRAQTWQLALPTVAYTKAGVGTDGRPGLAGILAMHQAAKSAPLIVTLHIEVARDTPAAECAAVTTYAWQQCAPAVGAAPNARAGEPLRGSLLAGELTVQVAREGEADLVHSLSLIHI